MEESMEMFIYIVSVVLAFGLGAFVGWNHMLGVSLRTLGKIVPIEEKVDKTMYAECEACGELDDLTETWFYVGKTGGPEESSVHLCPYCQNNDEVINEIRNEWYGV
tara:strand:- start:300 stop:617 length:318 start_codon:yes stop_codon:yes gene_type:complete